MARWLIQERLGEQAVGQSREVLPNGVFGAAAVRKAALEAAGIKDLQQRLQAIPKRCG